MKFFNLLLRSHKYKPAGINYISLKLIACRFTVSGIFVYYDTIIRVSGNQFCPGDTDG